MKKPDECANIHEIRAEIDRLDHRIVSTIAERQLYVRAASKYKNSEREVKDPRRLAMMLRQRRNWAQEEGLDPDAIERLFHDLVNHFAQEELTQWKASRQGPQNGAAKATCGAARPFR